MNLPSFRVRSPRVGVQEKRGSLSRPSQEFNRESYQQWKKEMGIEDEAAKSPSTSTLSVQDEEV